MEMVCTGGVEEKDRRRGGDKGGKFKNKRRDGRESGGGLCNTAWDEESGENTKRLISSGELFMVYSTAAVALGLFRKAELRGLGL